jgi:DNA-binding winged helix-turn-helix (wHTH) protein/Tfp pilus assembly protein PilF/TolB-like protein
MSLKNTPDFLQNLFRIEMSGGTSHSYRFKSFRLDIAERQLLKDEYPVPLTPKAFDVLVYLVERGGHLVEKEELMQTIWADAFVEDANLTRTIHTLRKALGEDQNGNKFIATVAKKGYRFVADVINEAAQTELPPDVEITKDIWPDESEILIADATSAGADSPAAKINTSWIVLAGVLFASSLAAFLAYIWNDRQPVATAKPISVAVLPFRAVNAVNQNDSYDLHFAYSLILQLDPVKNLKVRSFRATKDYTGEGQDAAIVGKEQKVDYVVQSSYMVAGGKLRVTSDLYNVKKGTVDATLNHDGPDVDLFAAGDIVASIFSRKLLAILNVVPAEPVANRGTQSEEAWKHYVHGMNLTNKRIREDSDKAIVEFENAVRIDPNFAEAYVGLSYAHETSYVNGGTKADHCMPGMEAANRAIELAPNLGEAYSIKAMNAWTCQRNRDESIELHRTALDLTPNSAFVRRFYGISLTAQGKGDESVAELRAAIDLDPNITWTEKVLGRALYFARRYDEAIEQLKKVRELDNNDPTQTAYLFRSYAQKGDFAQAFEWFMVTEEIKGSPQAQLDLFRLAYADSGWTGLLRARLERAELNEKNGRASLAEIASLAAQLGDTDKAFAYLDKKQYLSKPEPDLGNALIEPTFDSLRSDPRFVRLIQDNLVP